LIKITCTLNCIHNRDGFCELEDSTPLASFYEVECPFYEENLYQKAEPGQKAGPQV